MSTTFKRGDRVRITNSTIERYNGLAGFITRVEGLNGTVVQLDGEDSRSRFFNSISLRLEEKTMNIKQTVINTVKTIAPTSGKQRKGLAQLAFELLCAYAASTAADARKKKAKADAIKGGLILDEYRPGEVTSYSDDEFTVVAKTKEPTSKLDQTVLRAELSKAGLSKAKIDKAFVAATTENKPATTYEVIQN